MKSIALAAALAAAALTLTGCIGGMSKSIELIYDVEFSQSQAVQDFDTSDYSLDDDGIAQFQTLLRDHDIEPWNYRSAESSGCTGGITTTLRILYHGAGTTDLVIDGCAAPDGSFEADATRFFADWREAHAVVIDPSTLTNADIVAATFQQTQAVQGFDDSVYTQEGPDQIARLIAILDEYDVDPFAFTAPEGDPCPGGKTSEVTTRYRGTDATGLITVGTCTDDPFSAELTALISEWHDT